MSTTSKATAPSNPNAKIYKLTQQSLNLMRQILGSTGWAKTVQDIYIGGQLLSDDGSGLPELASIEWVKTDVQIRAMTALQRAAYQKKDEEWASKEVEFAMTPKQVESFSKAFTHFCEQGLLGPNRYLNEIIGVFGLVKGE